jgi:hypothetical protein
VASRHDAEAVAASRAAPFGNVYQFGCGLWPDATFVGVLATCRVAYFCW